MVVLLIRSIMGIYCPVGPFWSFDRLKEVIWLPNNIPSSPQPEAFPFTIKRLAMVACITTFLVLSSKSTLRELEKPTPLIPLETLKAFRQEIVRNSH